MVKRVLILALLSITLLISGCGKKEDVREEQVVETETQGDAVVSEETPEEEIEDYDGMAYEYSRLQQVLERLRKETE